MRSEKITRPNDPGRETKVPGPVFVCGRQHSGNTLVTKILGELPGYTAFLDESSFFEHRGLIDREKDPELKVAYLVEVLRLESPEEREHLRRDLSERLRRSPELDAVSLYRSGLAGLARGRGAEQWVEKATSYVFYAREILETLPEARLVFMLRNPYDIAASKKKRWPRQERILATALSWRKGCEIARILESEKPGRFRLVGYEELVRSPESTLRKLAGWLGAGFHPGLLEIPHLNRAETGYDLVGQDRGIHSEKLFSYRGTLSGAELSALDLLLRGSGCERRYPDLPHRAEARRRSDQLRAVGILLWAPFSYLHTYLRSIPRRPRHLWRRTIVRIRASWQ